MVNFYQKAVEDVTQKGKVASLALSGTIARKALHFWGLLPSYAINLIISQSEYNHEKKRLKDFFEPEIAAKLGKLPEDVTKEDLEEVSKNNPTIAEALQRNKNMRKLNFIVSSVAVTIAVFATAALLPLLGLGAGIAAFMAGAVMGLSLFLGVEAIAEPIGKKILGINEPSIDEVKLNPELQQNLSAPSQIKYLSGLQQNINPRAPNTFIKPEQVATTLIAANPAIGATIKTNYGADFSALPNEAKADVFAKMSGQYNIAQITSDLNNRLIRPQELVFTAHNQVSGVTKLESPHLNALEIANAKLLATQKRVSELTEQAKIKAANIGGKVKEGAASAYRKLGFNKSTTSVAVPENQEKLVAELKASPENFTVSAAPSAPTATTLSAKAPFDPGKLAEDRLKTGSIKPADIVARKEASQQVADRVT